MKFTKPVVAVALIAFIVLGSGCKTKDNRLTHIPGANGSAPGTDDTGLVPIGNPNTFDQTTGPGPFFPPGESVNTTGLEGTGGIGTERLDPNGPGYQNEGRPSYDDNYDQDKQIFAASTVYFDFDSSEIKGSERAKAEEVGIMLNEKAGHRLVINGHCDERGTEEYNRNLGEQRALSVRQYLVSRGVASDRIDTRSFGEDRPADPGHDATAWAKNRRAEFILLIPKNQ